MAIDCEGDAVTFIGKESDAIFALVEVARKPYLPP
jgi:hypothetical protein